MLHVKFYQMNVLDGKAGSTLFLTSMATISLDEEVRLYTTNAERERYNTLATLYGIVVALDYLERAYVRDAITAAECVLFRI
jgi:hypothetical protein